jgi:hypothetical protein
MVLEGDSLFVLPGLVDAHGAVDVGLPQVGSMAGIPHGIPPGRPGVHTPPACGRVPRRHGREPEAAKERRVIAAGVHPEGGMAPGQSAAVLLRLTSRTPKDLVLAPSVGLLFSFQGARGVYPSSLFAVVAHFRQTFEDASRHRLILSEYARDPRG